MKGVTVYLCNFLLLNSVSGLLWESFFGRKLLPKSMNSVGLFRLLMDQPSKLSATQLIASHNYSVEVHEVQTDDGYFLTVHRIPYGRKNYQATNRTAVLLFHSLFTSSDCWLLRGPTKDLAYLLADNGYDVWMTNSRGNFYSRKHVSLNPDTDKEFWDFSFHELGKYDLPATIDYILNKTGQSTLFYIGHSMGTTAFFTLASVRPEYNKKVKLMQAFGPAAFFVGNLSTSVKILRDGVPMLLKSLEKKKIYEVFPLRKKTEIFLHTSCKIPFLSTVCTAMMYAIIGFDNMQQNNTLLPSFTYAPAGSSAKLVRHFSQIVKAGNFLQYDYGPALNQEKYNSSLPSKYDLSKITAPIKLYYGDGDNLVSAQDAYTLQQHLPNCVGNIRVPFHTFNHMDFVYSNDAKSLVYDEVISTMNKYK